MLRWSFLLLFSAGFVTAQFRWKCDAKDGKFIVTPGANSKKFYCWDGQIFSEEKGYTPPPSFVLDYWAEVHRKSQQIREDIDRRGKELKEGFERSKEESSRLSQERMAANKQFNDNLNRQVSEHQRPSSASQHVSPKTVLVTAPEPAAAAATIRPASRVKADQIKEGMDRTTLEAALGKPHGSMSIPEDDGLLEVLTYNLDDRSTARVRIKQGRVVSIKILD
jgi:hypothetical protein